MPASSDEALRRAMEQARAPTQAAPACKAHETPRLGRVHAGEAALVRGDDDAAQLTYERTAAMQHCADAERSLVRTFMQTGQYRRAMAFVAHTASAHRETAGGAVLYLEMTKMLMLSNASHMHGCHAVQQQSKPSGGIDAVGPMRRAST